MKKIFKTILIGLSSLFTLGLISLIIFYFYLESGVPNDEEIENINLQVPLKIYDKQKNLISEIGDQRRIILSPEEIPVIIKKSIVAVEDHRFYNHDGYDIIGIGRALFEVIKNAGKITQGGSTITQQVARNFFLSPEKTYIRKAREILLSIKLENKYTKDEILYLYLNKIYLGNKAYGIAAAAKTYFNKKVTDLTISEVATIVGLPQSPSAANPITSISRATKRRNIVLGVMLNNNIINKDEYDNAIKEKIVIKRGDITIRHDYISELVKSILLKTYGEKIYSYGFEIYTTIDGNAQKVAITQLQNTMLSYDRRHEWRGVKKRAWDKNKTPITDKSILMNKLKYTISFETIKPVVITNVTNNKAIAMTVTGKDITLDNESVAWIENKNISKILTNGDIVYIQHVNGKYILSQIPQVNGAFISLDSIDGAIQTIVGGFSYDLSQFNRVTQSALQIGSSIKPFVYAAALNKGYTLGNVINDSPITIKVGKDIWQPRNDSNYSGPITLRRALAQSKNSVIVRLERSIGIKNIAKFIDRFEFDKSRYHVTKSLVLGTANFTPLEMARAYAAFNNGGFLINPYIIDSIVYKGKTIYKANPLIACNECSSSDSIYEEDNIIKNKNSNNIIKELNESFKQENKEIDLDGNNKQQNVNIDEALSLKPLQPNISKNSLDDDFKLPDNQPVIYAKRIIREDIAFLIRDALKTNIYGVDGIAGTGFLAKSLNRQDIGGKTGTTNNSRSAWFVGYGANYVAATYIGFDNSKPLGEKEYGSTTALPTWISFMKYNLSVTPEYNVRIPSNIIKIKIDPNTGYRFTNGYYEYFIKGTEPINTLITNKYNEDDIDNVDDLFK